MKTLIATLLMILPLAGIGGETRGQDNTPAYVSRMTEHLGLTEEQASQLTDIFHDHREQMRALREETEQKVNALLTEEQRTTLQALKAERVKKKKARDSDASEHGEDVREQRKADGPGDNDSHEHPATDHAGEHTH